ncbi:hypothetical protein LTS10_008005 [Elasticomyces elasticus]|nr:hypothetical protein LTS10_008005 [Elasticomyces elasticus]
MAKKVSIIPGRCPSTKIGLSGYSQGACVVHNAVQSQGVAASSIAAVVMFGDPFQSQSVGSIPSSKVLKLCASGDSICGTPSGGASGASRTSYGSDAGTAASFIEEATGVTK